MSNRSLARQLVSDADMRTGLDNSLWTAEEDKELSLLAGDCLLDFTHHMNYASVFLTLVSWARSELNSTKDSESLKQSHYRKN